MLVSEHFCIWRKEVILLSKLPVLTPISSLSTPSHSRTAASLATFLFKRCSSIPFIGFSKSPFVRIFPPITFLKSPLIAPKLDPMTPPAWAADCDFFSFAPSSIECTSESRSLSKYCPLMSLMPDALTSIESIAAALRLLSFFSPAVPIWDPAE